MVRSHMLSRPPSRANLTCVQSDTWTRLIGGLEDLNANVLLQNGPALLSVLLFLSSAPPLQISRVPTLFSPHALQSLHCYRPTILRTISLTMSGAWAWASC